LSGIIKGQRDQRYIQHTIQEMLTQRIGQIAAGYEDANDYDELCGDPILKILADRTVGLIQTNLDCYFEKK